MMTQFLLKLELNSENIERIKEFKVNRQLDRMANKED